MLKGAGGLQFLRTDYIFINDKNVIRASRQQVCPGECGI